MSESPNTEPQNVQPEPSTAEQSAAAGPGPEQQLAQMKDMLLRRAAEFENYKKRAEQDAVNLVRMANEGLVLAILPVVDDLERSLKAGKDLQDPSGFYKGVELIRQKLMKILESQGVTALETVGQPFNVQFHDALLQVQRPDAVPNTVIEEVEKGYDMRGKIIRHAKVVVAASGNDTEPAGAESGGEGG